MPGLSSRSFRWVYCLSSKVGTSSSISSKACGMLRSLWKNVGARLPRPSTAVLSRERLKASRCRRCPTPDPLCSPLLIYKTLFVYHGRVLCKNLSASVIVVSNRYIRDVSLEFEKQGVSRDGPISPRSSLTNRYVALRRGALYNRVLSRVREYSRRLADIGDTWKREKKRKGSVSASPRGR